MEDMDTQVYELADMGERFVALIIDLFIVGAIGGTMGVGGVGFGGAGILGLIVGGGYQWYFLTQQNGQTPGKMLMNIRVIKTTGQSITDADAILRYIGYLINWPLLMMGWIWAFIDSNQQGWHDKLAETYVIKAENNKQKNDDIFD